MNKLLIIMIVLLCAILLCSQTLFATAGQATNFAQSLALHEQAQANHQMAVNNSRLLNGLFLIVGIGGVLLLLGAGSALVLSYRLGQQNAAPQIRAWPEPYHLAPPAEIVYPQLSESEGAPAPLDFDDILRHW